MLLDRARAKEILGGKSATQLDQEMLEVLFKKMSAVQRETARRIFNKY